MPVIRLGKRPMCKGRANGTRRLAGVPQSSHEFREAFEANAVRNLLAKVPPPVAYIVSVAFDKGFSIITIPLVAAYLVPRDYGRLDVAVSLIEFTGIVMGFGMGETLIRFASTAGDDDARRRAGAELIGAALIVAVTLGAAIQIAAPAMAQWLAISVDLSALRLGLVAATVSALIEMPLVWLRLEGRAGRFLAFSVLRSLLQVLLLWLVLRAGWGADGILIANGVSVILLAAVLGAMQIHATGIALSVTALRRVGNYGVPIVGAMLAMFALGSLNRWFLSGRVPDAEIAFFGLAFKLALAAPLLLQPFALWWNARRIAALSSPNGLEESAWAWGLGYSVLTISALGVALVGPVFIEIALPKSYAGASIYLPFVVAICFLNELNTLCNAGAYARATGLAVLATNVAGALAAVAGYALLTPVYGVPGAIAAMIAGHVVRLSLFLWLGRELAPIRYPVLPAAIVLAVCVGAIWLAPASTAIAARLAWTSLAVVVVAALQVALGLLRIPLAFLPASLRRPADAVGRP
jgi:O-antigen/teichoic acid export membrane protein